MNFRLGLIFLILIFTSCGKVNTSDNIALLLNQSDNVWFRYNEMKTWKPNQAEIDLSEKLILKIIDEKKAVFNVKQVYNNIDNYFYQLIPYLDENNRKIIYVNSLCRAFVVNPLPNPNGKRKKEIGWKNNLIDVNDGGSCFWQVQIDIEKQEYFDFSVNGF